MARAMLCAALARRLLLDPLWLATLMAAEPRPTSSHVRVAVPKHILACFWKRSHRLHFDR